jgi:hypothetical protein
MKQNEHTEAGRLLEGLAPLAPPSGLRERVLGAAADRLLESARPDPWSGIWFHRGFRLAWAVTVVLLLVGHALVGLPRGTVHLRGEPRLAAGGGVDEPLADMLRTVHISDHVQPIVGLFAAAGDPADLPIGGNPS